MEYRPTDYLYMNANLGNILFSTNINRSNFLFQNNYLPYLYSAKSLDRAFVLYQRELRVAFFAAAPGKV